MSRRILFWLVLYVFSIVPAWAQTTVNRYNFNAGGGFGFGKSDVGKFTGTSYDFVVGGGLNLNRMLGVKAEYMYYNLAFKDAVKNFQGLQGATGDLQSLTLNPIANFSLGGRWGVYAIGGLGIYRRNVSVPSKSFAQGTVCQPAWIWWGVACDVNTEVPPGGFTLTSHTAYAGGYNFGGGFTYRLSGFHHAKLYAEGRYHHAYTGRDERTSFFPVTFGVRW